MLAVEPDLACEPTGGRGPPAADDVEAEDDVDWKEEGPDGEGPRCQCAVMNV